MKIRIGSGPGAIEREAEPSGQLPSVHAFFAKAPLEVRRARVRELVAQNRRRNFKLIAGGLPGPVSGGPS